MLKANNPLAQPKFKNKHLFWLILGGALLFYLLTLAPSVLWGDDAFFQYSAYAGERQPTGNNHWLWFVTAQLFTKLPIGTVAYRVNLVSAIAAALTVAMMFLAALEIGLRRDAAVVTAVSLAVAHTFWTHAVRAEVYTLFTFFMAIQLWLWLRWRMDDVRPFYAAMGLWGILFWAHQMTVLLLPAFIVLLWLRRDWLSRRQWGISLIWLAVGGVVFFTILTLEIARPAGVSTFQAMRLYLTYAGDTDFSQAMLDFSTQLILRDVALWLGFLGLQFVGIGGILGIIGGIAVWWKRPSAAWAAITTLYITSVLFAISYRVNDRFAFYLPSYVAFVLFIGAGWQWLTENWLNRKPRLRIVLLAGILLIPLFTYYAISDTMTTLDINPLGVRDLPGREPNWFFLWPAKTGYLGAETYGRTAFAAVPPNGALLADHTPYEALRYLQQVEGVRPDVNLIKVQVGADITPVLDTLPPDTAVCLADNNPNYYNLSQLTEWELQPVLPIYCLRPK